MGETLEDSEKGSQVHGKGKHFTCLPPPAAAAVSHFLSDFETAVDQTNFLVEMEAHTSSMTCRASVPDKGYHVGLHSSLSVCKAG